MNFNTLKSIRLTARATLGILLNIMFISAIYQFNASNSLIAIELVKYSIVLFIMYLILSIHKTIANFVTYYEKVLELRRSDNFERNIPWIKQLNSMNKSNLNQNDLMAALKDLDKHDETTNP